jgi:hypothetical protein
METTTSTSSAGQVRLKSVAIPPEHGSWGFLLEPIILGLAIAPSLAGLFLALAVVGVFLARHPLKIAFTDWRRGKRYARTVAAQRFALGYSALAVIGFGAAVALAGFDFLLPLLLAVPLAAIQFGGYALNRRRDLLPELAGASAMAVSASCLVMAGGEKFDLALVLWIILVARDVPSILYIRARLRLDRGKPFAFAPILLANLVAVAGVIVLVLAGLAPILAVVAMIALLLRAIHGLSPYRQKVRVQIVGILEMGYGFLTVLLTILGYGLGS